AMRSSQGPLSQGSLPAWICPGDEVSATAIWLHAAQKGCAPDVEAVANRDGQARGLRDCPGCHLGRELDTQHVLQLPSITEPPYGVHPAAVKALGGKERLDRGRPVARCRRAQPLTVGRLRTVQVDDDEVSARTKHPMRLGQTRLAAGTEKVRDARVREVNAAIRDGQLLGAAGAYLDRRQVTHPAARANNQRRMWLNTDNAAGPPGELRQVKPVPAADVDDVGTTPVDLRGQRSPHRSVGVDGLILPLVDIRPVPDVRAGQH